MVHCGLKKKGDLFCRITRGNSNPDYLPIMIFFLGKTKRQEKTGGFLKDTVHAKKKD